MGGFRQVSSAGARQDDGHMTWVRYRMLKTTEVPTFPYGDGLEVYGYVPVVSSSSQDFHSGKAEDSTMEPRLRRKQQTINNEIFYSPPPPQVK